MPCSKIARSWERAGFELDAFGPTRLALRRVPALLASADIAATVAAVVRDLELDAGVHHLDGAVDKFLGTLACRDLDPCAPAPDAARDERASAADGGRPSAPTSAITAVPTWTRLTLVAARSSVSAGTLMAAARRTARAASGC